MEIIDSLEFIPNLSIALGYFDGVHIGHRAVIHEAVEQSYLLKCPSAVITFDKHPYSYINNTKQKCINKKEDKYDLISKLGVDYLIELRFEEICDMSAYNYLNLLISQYSPKAISTGFNHHFGVNRIGTVSFLASHQKEFNYIYTATPPQMILGEIVSSSAIRNYISQGEIPLANAMLGSKFFIKGKVVKGRGLGSELGFPTANIEFPENIITPAYGVYHTETTIEGKTYKSVTNFGTCPTVSLDSQPSLETHILDFNEDIYNKEIKVAFIKKLRDEQKFESSDDLKKQIESDISNVEQKFNF